MCLIPTCYQFGCTRREETEELKNMAGFIK